MKKSPQHRTNAAFRTDTGPKHLIPALVAVGGGLAALPAVALELGDVKVNSSLGQPLRASIAVALAPNEAIYDTCVSLQGSVPSTGMPTVGRASISVANGVISIAGQSVVREPLLSMRVNVRCPYTPHLSRDYMLFVDPARPSPATVVEPAAATTSVRPIAQTSATPAPAAVSRRTVSRPANNDPISNATRYRVQPGDSLSQIAQRIENRPIGLWAAVGAIFDANPDAFIGNDPNKLKAGSWLNIPDLGAGAPLTVADNNIFPTSAADLGANQPAAIASEAYSGADAAATLEAATLEAATLESAAEQAPVLGSPAETVDSPVADLQPGDVILESDNQYVTTGNETVVIPDTSLEGPETISSSPNVPVATVQQPATETTSTNWLLWLAGSGVGIMIALILFGRRGRNRYGSAPIGAVATPQRRKTDTGTHRVAPVAESTIEVEELESFDLIQDDSPTHENLALDADLVMGTGLSESSDVDVAQDFGFAATTDLDLELPEEMSSGYYEKPETDIIPPLNIDPDSILESEVLSDEDDYDMSVIVDATKMPLPEDVTQRDLEAIAVDTTDERLITDDYTLSKEVDYQILEQDYEEELTATQILNEQISKAAAELSARMDVKDDNEEDTSEMSLASVTAIDITAQLPANNDELSDLDDTGVNEAIATVNMDGEDKTVEMVSDDNTVEMPRKTGGSGK